MLDPTKPQPNSPDKTLRILQVVDSLDVGGAERHVADLAVALRENGHQVTIACSRNGHLSEILSNGGVPVREASASYAKRRVSVDFARGLGKLVANDGYDLVHAHMFASAAAVLPCTRREGIPLVLTEHSEGTWRSDDDRRVVRRIYQQAARILAVSQPIRTRLVDDDGVDADIVKLVPCAVMPPTLGAKPRVPGGVGKGPVIGVVARLQAEKGVGIFLQAAATIKMLVPEVTFVIVGDGPLREDLVGQAEGLDIARDVRFLGFRTDARGFLGHMDVLCVPSLTEGSPLVTLEAMAAGVPIVATTVGGIPNQITEGKEGLLVPPGDAEALCSACTAILRDPRRARRMGAAGRTRLATEFRYDAMIDKIETVYREASDAPAKSAVA